MFRLVVLVAALQATAAFQPLATKPSIHPVSLQASVQHDAQDMPTTTNRRAFLGSSLAILLAGGTASHPSYADEGTAVDYKAVSADIADLIKANPDWGPTFVRVAWHSCGKCSRIKHYALLFSLRCCSLCELELLGTWVRQSAV